MIEKYGGLAIALYVYLLFTQAYLTCDTVSIPTDGFSEEQNPSTALQLLRRIHTHYIHQPIPPLPAECLTGIMGAGDAESEVKFVLEDLILTNLFINMCFHISS